MGVEERTGAVERERLTSEKSKKALPEKAAKLGSDCKEAARDSQGFGSVVGQTAPLERLRAYASLYTQSRKPPAHVLLTGIDGLGKSTMARAFAAEYCERHNETDVETLARPGDLMGILTNLNEGDALLVPGISKTPQTIVRALASALKESAIDFVVDKGMFAKTINVPLKRFTCIATSGSRADCPPELIEAFSLILPLQSYSQPELVTICQRLAQKRGITITAAAAGSVVGTSAGTPHSVEVLVDRLGALGWTSISEEDVAQVWSALGLNPGLVSSTSPVDFGELKGAAFEKAIALLLQRMGFHTEMTEVTGDGGVDIIATLAQPVVGGRYLIQCKGFGPAILVGAAAVRDFYGALKADRNAIKGIFITTTGFTSEAQSFAAELPIELIGGQQLRGLLTKFGLLSGQEGLPASLFDDP
jgi:Holliday junction resolvasome RuvABC ATP-dependent DNA helicase subunit